MLLLPLDMVRKIIDCALFCFPLWRALAPVNFIYLITSFAEAASTRIIFTPAPRSQKAVLQSWRIPLPKEEM